MLMLKKILIFLKKASLKDSLASLNIKKNSIIEIVTTASSIPEEVGAEYVKAFHYLGAKNTNVLHIGNREGST
jgi:cyanophycinase